MRMAVIGDSVPWGQGLLPEHKFAGRVQQHLGGPGTVELLMQAHSGAVIRSARKPPAAVDAEVPIGGPTILAQVGQVPDPTNVDLVLLDGGINDVGVWVIVDPLTAPPVLRAMTRAACYTGMKKLLARAAATFTHPGCRFVVTGYYPILSADSDVLGAGADMLTRFLNFHGVGVAFNLPQGLVLELIIALTTQFWRDSEKYLARAVAESATDLALGARLIHVPSPFAEANALFASDPWLFGFGPGVKPEDEVSAPRAAACNRQYPNPLELVPREACYLASVGHPNVAGAHAIAAAIIARL